MGKDICHLVVVDKFSKLVKFAPTQTNTMTTGMAKLFFDMWVWHNGMPKIIVSDRDVKFMSKFMTLLMKKVGTKLKFSTVFHPQINGQVEKVNEMLNQYFRNYIVSDHKDLSDHLGLEEFCYNSTKHLAIKMSPFELTLGVEVKQPMDLTITRTRSTWHKGGKEAKVMAKDHEKKKTQAIKLLKKV
jgi:transposase InsO family protein